MNKLQLILFSMLFCLSSFMMSADNSNGGFSKEGDSFVLLYKNTLNRPNSQEQQYLLNGYYGRGYMVFELPAGVESLTVVIKQRNFTVWQGDVTIDEPYTEIPTYFSGEYDVECITDMGQLYEGAIEL